MELDPVDQFLAVRPPGANAFHVTDTAQSVPLAQKVGEFVFVEVATRVTGLQAEPGATPRMNRVAWADSGRVAPFATLTM